MAQFDQVLGPVALGDQFQITFPLEQADGTPWTPSASAAEWRAKLARDDEDDEAVIAKEMGTGITVAGSTATVQVMQADQAALAATLTLYWSLRITDSTLGPVTVGAGTLKLVREAVRE